VVNFTFFLLFFDRSYCKMDLPPHLDLKSKQLTALMKESSSCMWGEQAKLCPCPSKFRSQYKYRCCVLETVGLSGFLEPTRSSWSRWRKQQAKTSKL